MVPERLSPHPANRALAAKYRVTAWFYDLLDAPWERIYRRWRPRLLGDLSGRVLEAGVGTGRNLPYYPPAVRVTAIDLCDAMLRIARRRARRARCPVELRLDDATQLATIADESQDWVVATFLCCVMPDDLQPGTLVQFRRVLRPGGRFRLLEILYSRDPRIRRRQERLARFVERVYGARFDRATLRYVEQAPGLAVRTTTYLKDDTYLLIEGERVA
ncbi:MAG: class I SAM-dependent methyltransferase [Nitrospirae bacterium]|nr:MAG: class I SAM-dependent methyltransferase [Nitrospirota bacterium]